MDDFFFCNRFYMLGGIIETIDMKEEIYFNTFSKSDEYISNHPLYIQLQLKQIEIQKLKHKLKKIEKSGESKFIARRGNTQISTSFQQKNIYDNNEDKHIYSNKLLKNKDYSQDKIKFEKHVRIVKVPKNWPKNVIYTNNYIYDGLPTEIKQKVCRGINSLVRIKKIEDPNHPGKCFLF